MDPIGMLLPLMLLALIALMIFQITRQRKGIKQMQQLQASLSPGDRVLTTSGMHATVVGTEEATVDLEIAPGVHTTWDRRVIREKVDPGASAGSSGTESAGSTEPAAE